MTVSAGLPLFLAARLLRYGRMLTPVCLSLLALTAGSQIAWSSDQWPKGHPVRIVVPYAAGSNGDAVGRVTANYLSEAFPGSRFFVENRPGTGGIIGTRSFVRSEPDGYIVCVCSGGAVTVPSVVEKGYDPLRDLEPVGLINTSALVMIVNAESPVNSVAEVVAWSKAKSGGLSYGSSGVGGIMYNAAEIFRNKSGADMTHVPFRGGPDAIAALLSGQIDVVFAIMSDVLGQVQTKTVKPIAVTTPERSELLPEVPTMIEEGVPNYDVTLWNGLFVPVGTPAPVITALSQAVLKMPNSATTKQAMLRLGSIVKVNGPTQFKSELAAEVSQWDSYLKGVARQ
jgi:tripartite-type tricarboxylate transporter receptor subunit TctC